MRYRAIAAEIVRIHRINRISLSARQQNFSCRNAFTFDSFERIFFILLNILDRDNFFKELPSRNVHSVSAMYPLPKLTEHQIRALNIIYHSFFYSWIHPYSMSANMWSVYILYDSTLIMVHQISVMICHRHKRKTSAAKLIAQIWVTS